MANDGYERELGGLNVQVKILEKELATLRGRLGDLERWRAYILGISFGVSGLVSAIIGLIALWISAS